MNFLDAAEGIIVGLSTNRQNTRQGIRMGMEFFGRLPVFVPVFPKL
jgi:hypothetical protein